MHMHPARRGRPATVCFFAKNEVNEQKTRVSILIIPFWNTGKSPLKVEELLKFIVRSAGGGEALGRPWGGAGGGVMQSVRYCTYAPVNPHTNNIGFTLGFKGQLGKWKRK